MAPVKRGGAVAKKKPGKAVATAGRVKKKPDKKPKGPATKKDVKTKKAKAAAKKGAAAAAVAAGEAKRRGRGKKGGKGGKKKGKLTKKELKEKKRAEAERLKQEAAEAEERAKKFAEASGQRLEQLKESAAVINQYEKLIFGHLKKLKELLEWEFFIACKDTPDISNLIAVNSYMSEWIEDLKEPSLEAVFKYVPGVLEVVDGLKTFLQIPPEDVKVETVYELGLMYQEFQEKMREYLDEGTFHLLEDLHEHYDPEIGVFEHISQNPEKNLTHALWGNLYGMPGHTEHEYTGEGFGFKIPSSIAENQAVFRLLKTAYNHYSDKSNSYYAPGVDDALKQSIENWEKKKKEHIKEIAELETPEEPAEEEEVKKKKKKKKGKKGKKRKKKKRKKGSKKGKGKKRKKAGSKGSKKKGGKKKKKKKKGGSGRDTDTSETDSEADLLGTTDSELDTKGSIRSITASSTAMSTGTGAGNSDDEVPTDGSFMSVRSTKKGKKKKKGKKDKSKSASASAESEDESTEEGKAGSKKRKKKKKKKRKGKKGKSKSKSRSGSRKKRKKRKKKKKKRKKGKKGTSKGRSRSGGKSKSSGTSESESKSDDSESDSDSEGGSRSRRKKKKKGKGKGGESKDRSKSKEKKGKKGDKSRSASKEKKAKGDKAKGGKSRSRSKDKKGKKKKGGKGRSKSGKRKKGRKGRSKKRKKGSKKKKKGKSKSKERKEKALAEKAKTAEELEKSFFIVKTQPHELNLRHFSVNGLLYDFRMLHVPPQPVDRGEWTLHLIEYPRELREIEFEQEFEEPPEFDLEAEWFESEEGKAITEKESEFQKLVALGVELPAILVNEHEETVKLNAEKKKEFENTLKERWLEKRGVAQEELLAIEIKLSEEVIWFEQPTPVRWEPDERLWSTNGFDDVKFDPETLSIRFFTTSFGVLGFASDRWLNIPYQNWELRPDEGGRIKFKLTAKIVTIEFTVQDDMICVSSVKDAPHPEKVTEKLLNKYMKPGVLIKMLREAGLDVFPDFDSYAYMPGLLIKQQDIEDHVYQCMAIVSSVFNFSCSKWNQTVGRDRIVIQMQPKSGSGQGEVSEMSPVLNTSLMSTYVNCTETSKTFSDAPRSGMEFTADLLTLATVTSGPEVHAVLNVSNDSKLPPHVEAVRLLLQAVRPISFTLYNSENVIPAGTATKKPLKVKT